MNRQTRDAHRQLDVLCAKLANPEPPAPGQPHQQRDAATLRSLPGAGRIVLATLRAEAAEPLRRRDYHALRSLCGVAPVTRHSGKHFAMVMRHVCHMWLRTAVYHWVRVAMQHDEQCLRRYRALRACGHSHGRTLHTVADRLLEVACTMLRTGTPFDPVRAAVLNEAA